MLLHLVSRLARLRALLLVLALGVIGASAAAQDTAPKETPVPPAETLLEILRDDTSRQALIAELERLTETEVEEAVEAEPPVAQSVGRRIANVTQEAANSAAENLQSFWSSLSDAPDALDGLADLDLEIIFDAFGELLLVIVATVAVFLTLRGLAIPIYRRMGLRARSARLGHRTLIYFGSGLMDVLVVVGAWAIGYAIAVLALGQFGDIGIRETLYLNAFVAVEMVKVGMRMLLSPSTGDLRPLPVGDRPARYLSRQGNVIFSLLGYGQLLVVPIVNESASFGTGRAVATLIWVLAILYVAVLVWRKRKPVAAWLIRQTAPTEPRPEAVDDAPVMTPVEATTEDPDATEPASAEPAAAIPPRVETARAEDEVVRPAPRRSRLAPVANAWHWIVLAYLLAILVIVLTEPGDAVVDALAASAKIAVALIVGLVLSGLLAKAIARGIHLPPSVNERLPLLQRRLNRFVPQALLALRLVILIALVFYTMDVVGLFDAGGWLESDFGLRFTGTIVSVAVMLLVGFLIWIAMTSWVDYRLNPDFGDVPTAREQTLLSLLRNAATIALLILTLMFVLSEIGLNIGPLLASAGVLGLAIGFGAQKMVQDIITGIFIQFENAINVGDVVTAGGITGAVERLTIRSVSLRDLTGVYHIIPFSSVDLVSNFTREFSYYVIDMGIAYRENVEEVKRAMMDAFDELRRHPDQGAFLLGDLEWFGLDAFGDSAVILKSRIKTLPGKQWGVGRAYNEIVKRIFDERDIEIPFPHQTIYFGQDKGGNSPPLRVADARDDG
ncbi:mechanosensitive ion channel domain-containing protein [Roseitranquillus sediminis]|uniref:mechanosensitive ion channel domain-containing protein n=1 Tax=Roseitranquillus sediminis TaxID=2809051 RepID=UPI001D0BFCF4|nr:mechanosensitive ion channel domain-containing protein [Roseitranquillus sediminis]MBM9593836.1 mechanosensitive ion channel [Roseitranquillus sediminis]